MTQSGRWAANATAVTVDQPAPAWFRQIGPRVRQSVLLKSIGTPVVIVVFLLLYQYLLNHPIFPVTEMPLTALDRVVGFYSPALVLYASLWLYVSIPPALLESRVSSSATRGRSAACA